MSSCTIAPNVRDMGTGVTTGHPLPAPAPSSTPVIVGVVAGRVVCPMAGALNAAAVVVDVVVRGIVPTPAAAAAVVVGVMIGRVVHAVALVTDFRHVATPVTVDGVIDAAADAREGDPPLQRFELELASGSFLARLHLRDSL